ncbi:MAG: non-canonical purine NTP pyrophosphatase, partial [Pseudomonadota bacterium]
MQKLVIASNNPGKLREIGHLLEPLGIEVLPQSAFNI